MRDNERALGFYDHLGFEIVEVGVDAETGASFGALALRRDIGSAGD